MFLVRRADSASASTSASSTADLSPLKKLDKDKPLSAPPGGHDRLQPTFPTFSLNARVSLKLSFCLTKTKPPSATDFTCMSRLRAPSSPDVRKVRSGYFR